MKKSIIKEIMYEKVGTINSMKPSKKYLQIANKLNNLEHELTNKLDNEAIKLFEQFLNLQDNLESETIDHYYIEGFKISACVGFECAEKRK